MKFYPYQGGGGVKGFSYAEGGTTSFMVVLTREPEVLAIHKAGATSFTLS